MNKSVKKENIKRRISEVFFSLAGSSRSHARATPRYEEDPEVVGASAVRTAGRVGRGELVESEEEKEESIERRYT